jgi:outer membrane protein OmpA-like peptidoglycan-associated protein
LHSCHVPDRAVFGPFSGGPINEAGCCNWHSRLPGHCRRLCHQEVCRARVCADAQTTRDTRALDGRAQQGIQGAKNTAAQADQRALSAGQQAGQAQQLAANALNGTNSLAERVANFDNYKPVAETSVHFAFDKAELRREDRQHLDEIAGRIPSTKSYILQIEGNTDSVGDAQYNYELSQRRASAVIQYLAHNYNVPPHKIYVIGLGKDRPEARNSTARGRAENRRVEVRLMTNIQGEAQHPNRTSAARQGPLR